MTNHSNVVSRGRRRLLPPRRYARVVAGLALSGLVLAACADDDPEATPEEDTHNADARAAENEDSDHDSEHGNEHGNENEVTEVSARSPRLAITYDGGVQVLDATTMEVVDDIELDGFNRLNPAGDQRHLFVSTTGGFQLLDTGTWAEPHGDHSHYYTAEPELTDMQVDAETPGHVVVHHGRTALFDDATGGVTVFDSGEAANPDREEREHTTPAAHHGVAVELSDGSLVVSEGNEETRTGMRVLDADNKEIAASDECPGLHGEATAADEVVVVGCEDGVLTYADGTITKIDSPDAYGRIGNQAGSEDSPIVLGDYKTDPEAELERPTQISLIDTRTSEITLVDVPASYSFRSLARGADGEALVLGTDGQIHVIDPKSAEVVQSIPVIDEWEEPMEWQEARPTLTMLDGSAYVTDPATNTIHAVDVPTGEVWRSTELGVAPNEISGVTGGVVDGVSTNHSGDHGGGDHGGDHEHGHDHDH